MNQRFDNRTGELHQIALFQSKLCPALQIFWISLQNQHQCVHHPLRQISNFVSPALIFLKLTYFPVPFNFPPMMPTANSMQQLKKKTRPDGLKSKPEKKKVFSFKPVSQSSLFVYKKNHDTLENFLRYSVASPQHMLNIKVVNL